MFENMSNSDRSVLGLGGLLMVAALASGEAGVFVLLVVLAIAFFMRNNDRWQGSDEIEYIEERTPRERPANTEQIHQHALAAVRRAGLHPSEVKVLAVDIGLISFHGDEKPVLHRSLAVEDDCDYIQPFVQLRVPVAAQGRVKFEIYDNTGQAVFIHEDNYQLKRGRNLIIPSTRLPVHDEQEMDGQWEVRITADNMMIASHLFQWQDSDAAGFHHHVAEDGEMNSELRALLAESRLEPMSLDELLEHQEQEAQRRASS